MKKILGLLVVCVVLSNCEISTRKAHANYGPGHYRNIETVVYNNMTYLIIETTTSTDNGGVNITTLNLTKDALECEYYRKQISKSK